jgi:hypothetical protein
MAFNTFCTTFCAALATLAASAPAIAIVPDAGPATTGITAAREGARTDAASQQVSSRLLFESDAPIGMAGTDAANGAPATGSMSLLNQTGTYFGDLIAGDIAYRPHAQGASEPEPVSLPLLGAAGVALLIAQLRRSRRPAVR